MGRGWSELGAVLVGYRDDADPKDDSLRSHLSQGDSAELVDALITGLLDQHAVVLAVEDDAVAIVKTYGPSVSCYQDLQRVWDAVNEQGGPVLVAEVGVGAPIKVRDSMVGVVAILGPGFGKGLSEPLTAARTVAALMSQVVENQLLVAERKLVSHQRDDLSERLRALIETDLEGAAFVDDEGIVRYVNDRFIEILGWDRDAITNAKVVDHLLPLHRDTVMAMLDLSSQGVAKRYVGDFNRQDGDWRWLEIEVSPIHDGESENMGSWVVINDRTEEKHSNEALLASERWFRALVDQSDDYIIVLDKEGTIRYLSPSAERLIGPLIEVVPGQNAFAFIHPEDVERVMEGFFELLQEPGGQRRTSYRSISPDGTWHTNEVVATNLFDDPDVAGMVINSRDVTARLRFERLVVGQAKVLEMVLNRASLPDSFAAVVSLVEETIDGSRCQICWVSPETGRTSTLAAPSLEAAFCESIEALLSPEYLVGLKEIETVAMTGHEVWDKARHAPGGEEFHWCDVVPIGGLGEPCVVMLVFRGNRLAVLQDDDARSLERVRSFSQVVMQRTLAEEALSHQSTHDPLTGLANRTLLFEGLDHALARARRNFSMLAVLFIDVDRFKLVNDSLGHAAGDLVLRELAQRLSTAVRPFDTLARFGGDEFVVICEGLDHPAGAAAIAERISEVLQIPMDLAGRDYFLNVSIGIALDVGGSATTESLVRDADVAMYRAKNRGGNCHEVFNAALRRQANERLEVEGWLRRALERDELFVAYQPVVKLPEGEIVGFEALVRWDHPNMGIQLPDRFISLAEETGLIGPIGAHVLNTACVQAARWQQLSDTEHVPWISVNLSPRQLEGSTVVKMVTEALEFSGLPPSQLCLEITESAAMDESPATVRTLRSLHRLGIRLAIDDFGSGYSSLAYLKQMPVDSIKIDRSLAEGLGSDPGDSAIVSAVISMASSLGIDVVVEGVENPDQVRELITLNCPYAQGFYYGVPSSAETLLGVPTSLGGLPS